ncbi:MAG TPA: hypothetical protein PLK08_00890 [Phycisphaerae bacterium]|nr:hypothetical protein [Phycisphaerae bacterium]
MLAVLLFSVSPAAAISDDENLQKVYAALELGQADHDVLAKLSDGTENIHENEFFWMMKKISALPSLSQDELNQLDAPAWKTLISAPQRFRFLPVRMKVCVYTLQKLSVENRHLIRSPYWPSDRPIYRIHAVKMKGNEPNPNEPLVIFSQTLPPNLPEKSELQADGQTAYKTGPLYEIAGVFYKYIETGNSTGTFVNKYPVILAWQMNPAKIQAPQGALSRFAFGIVILIIALAIAVFMFLKRRIRSQKKGFGYETLFSHDKSRTESEEDIDPMSAIPNELADAAREYRLEHPDEPADAK